MIAADEPVAVLGGGIAGAAACLRLLEHGLAPLWFAPEPEEGPKPGEHLAPAARPLLADLGAFDLLDRPDHRPANAMYSAWGSARIMERNAIVHLEGPATVIDRVILERDLTERVLSRSVERVAVRVDDVSWRDGTWRLRAEESAWRAGFVIDATGRVAIVARDQAVRFRADRLAALVAFLDQDPGSDVEPTRATLIESVADGWWYAALLADGRLVLNLYTDPDLLPDGASRDPAVLMAKLNETTHIDRWVAEADFRLQAPPRLVSAGTTWIAPAAGETWIAVGDAAAAYDPLSSHGMTTALWTARNGADAVAARLAGDPEPLRRYAEAVAGGIQDFLVSRAKIYGQEIRFADHPFWQRRHRSMDIEAARNQD